MLTLRGTFVAKISYKLLTVYRKYVFRIIGVYKKTVVVKTSSGKYKIDLRDKTIGRELYMRRDGWEKSFIDDVYKLLKKTYAEFTHPDNTVMYDIGANIGTTAIQCLLRGYTNYAIAIEADLNNYNLLKENVKLNHLDDCLMCIHSAVSDSSSTLEIVRSKTNYGDYHTLKDASVLEGKASYTSAYTVNADTLPNLLVQHKVSIPKDKNAIVWLDVQGHEKYCIEGMADWLKEFKESFCVCEIFVYMMRDHGVNIKEFCTLVASIWNFYHIYMDTHRAFIKFPISQIETYMVSAERHQFLDNVVFTTS